MAIQVNLTRENLGAMCLKNSAWTNRLCERLVSYVTPPKWLLLSKGVQLRHRVKIQNIFIVSLFPLHWVLPGEVHTPKSLPLRRPTLLGCRMPPGKSRNALRTTKIIRFCPQKLCGTRNGGQIVNVLLCPPVLPRFITEVCHYFSFSILYAFEPDGNQL